MLHAPSSDFQFPANAAIFDEDHGIELDEENGECVLTFEVVPLFEAAPCK